MKNKKTLIAIIAVLLVLVVGATIAYFQSSASFENVFNTGTYKVVTTEEFVSPDNWKPGEEIPKTIKTTNEGTIDAAVRVSYTEKWEDSEGNIITNSIDEGTAIINLDNQNDWTKEGNYYYYNYILEPGKTTSSFIKSVTLNPNIGSDITCTSSQDGLTKTCTSSNSALGAKYTLTVTKETVQADKYQSVWNTSVEITEKPQIVRLPADRTKDNLKLGDEICLEGDTTECFNFVRYDENDDIVMLSKYLLNVGEKGIEPISNLQDKNIGVYTGTVQFSETRYWLENNTLKLKYGTEWDNNNIYDSNYATLPDFSSTGYSTPGYSIAYYVEEYRKILENYGANIKDARLITYSELTDPSIGCDGRRNYACPGSGKQQFIVSRNYWVGSARTDTGQVWSVSSNTRFQSCYFASSDDYGVRPVIVIEKEDI